MLYEGATLKSYGHALRTRARKEKASAAGHSRPARADKASFSVLPCVAAPYAGAGVCLPWASPLPSATESEFALG